MAEFGVLIVVVACVWIAAHAWLKPFRLKRAEFIRAYEWPPGLLAKLEHRYPALKQTDPALVSRGLKQFFIAHLMSGNRFVSMPSRIVDDLWHEFILYTLDYKRFCAKAFGRFMHHTPAVAMGPAAARRIDDGLRRAWWFACKEEDIDPKRATRLPLLFALDGQLQVAEGFRYDLDCDALRKNGVTGVHCATDLTADSPTTGVPCGG